MVSFNTMSLISVISLNSLLVVDFVIISSGSEAMLYNKSL